ncbi:MAG: protein-glutamate O-methyltransferase CheR [Candidatus Omnitrophica bacterium]|nr:protein-glutamate O-methyltransferase CheR [Candidatus Omnitrophota bacterium]
MEEPRDVRSIPAEELVNVLHFISGLKGIDLSSYRQNFCFRHLRGRLQDTDCFSGPEYINYIKKNRGEIDRFLDDLSINVTHFFRDREVFESFKTNALDEIIKKKSAAEKGLIRIWSAACATGQEPYSLAIMLAEALRGKPGIMVKIRATDVDSDALAKAAEGVYEGRDFREIDKKLLEKYFEPVYNGKYSVRDDIRKMVKFEKHNLITDDALRFIDIIFCRNVMIYFTREQQDMLIEKFYGSLTAGGYLVIAKVECIWKKGLFSAVDACNKIYQKAA